VYILHFALLRTCGSQCVQFEDRSAGLMMLSCELTLCLSPSSPQALLCQDGYGDTYIAFRPETLRGEPVWRSSKKQLTRGSCSASATLPPDLIVFIHDANHMAMLIHGQFLDEEIEGEAKIAGRPFSFAPSNRD